MALELTSAQARRWRRSAHGLGGSELSATAVVRRAVALQGQDLAAVLRAIALRSLPGTSVADVVGEFNRGHLVRSWPMRGTLFATTPHHLAALRHFTAARMHRATIRRREQLGLEDRLLDKAAEVASAALAERALSRAEVLGLWEQHGIDTTAGRGYHLLFHHAVGGLWHWGRFIEGRTEQLLEPSVPIAITRPEEALQEIIRGFVEARGPVAEADLAWWTKLPKSMLRQAIATMTDLAEVSVDGSPAWVVEGQTPDVAERAGIDLLPAFDEWILGYGDRTLVATPETMAAVVPGNNGVFRPVVLLDGVVVGTWRSRPRRGEEAFTPTQTVSASNRKRIEKAIASR